MAKIGDVMDKNLDIQLNSTFYPLLRIVQVLIKTNLQGFESRAPANYDVIRHLVTDR